MKNNYSTKAKVKYITTKVTNHILEKLTETLSGDRAYSYFSYEDLQNLIMQMLQNDPEAHHLLTQTNTIQKEVGIQLREQIRNHKKVNLSIVSLFEKGFLLITGKGELCLKSGFDISPEHKWYPSAYKPSVVYVPFVKTESGQLQVPTRLLGFSDFSNALSMAHTLAKHKYNDKDTLINNVIEVIAVPLYAYHDAVFETHGNILHSTTMKHPVYPIHYFEEIDACLIDSFSLMRFLMGETLAEKGLRTTSVFERHLAETHDDLVEIKETDPFDLNHAFYYDKLKNGDLCVCRTLYSWMAFTICAVKPELLTNATFIPVRNEPIHYTDVQKHSKIMKGTTAPVAVSYTVSTSAYGSLPHIAVLDIESKAFAMNDPALSEAISREVAESYRQKQLNEQEGYNKCFYQHRDTIAVPGMKDRMVMIIHRESPRHPVHIYAGEEVTTSMYLDFLKSFFRKTLIEVMYKVKSKLSEFSSPDVFSNDYGLILVKGNSGYKVIMSAMHLAKHNSYGQHSQLQGVSESKLAADIEQVMIAYHQGLTYTGEDFLCSVTVKQHSNIPLMTLVFDALPTIQEREETIRLTQWKPAENLSHIHGTFYTDLHGDQLTIMDTVLLDKLKNPILLETGLLFPFTDRGVCDFRIQLVTGNITMALKEFEDGKRLMAYESQPLVLFSTGYDGIKEVVTNGHQEELETYLGDRNRPDRWGQGRLVIENEVEIMGLKPERITRSVYLTEEEMEDLMKHASILASSKGASHPVFAVTLAYYNSKILKTTLPDRTVKIAKMKVE